ncbi:MAG: LapA family protein, partial [Smithellaceae bacterium]|nr:LapA family protein [Smithellaceae bacterium]
SLANIMPVELKYYDLIDITIPTYMVIFISFLAGVVFTGFMGIVERFRLTRTITKQNKTIRELRRELKARGLEGINGDVKTREETELTTS